MPDKENKSEFKVTDRRLFSREGELRQDVVEAEERSHEREQATAEAQERANQERSAQAASQRTPAEVATPDQAPEFEPPTEQEQQVQADAYKKSTQEIDARLRSEMGKQGQRHRAEDFDVTFEKFVASLYMTALMQLGLAAPEGSKPQVDILGARQTIDTLALLRDKTKGNLTPAEENMLQNVLYELRMAYLEVMNLINNPPPAAGPHVRTGS